MTVKCIGCIAAARYGCQQSLALMLRCNYAIATACVVVLDVTLTHRSVFCIRLLHRRTRTKRTMVKFQMHDAYCLQELIEKCVNQPVVMNLSQKLLDARQSDLNDWWPLKLLSMQMLNKVLCFWLRTRKRNRKEQIQKTVSIKMGDFVDAYFASTSYFFIDCLIGRLNGVHLPSFPVCCDELCFATAANATGAVVGIMLFCKGC